MPRIDEWEEAHKWYMGSEYKTSPFFPQSAIKKVYKDAPDWEIRAIDEMLDHSIPEPYLTYVRDQFNPIRLSARSLERVLLRIEKLLEAR